MRTLLVLSLYLITGFLVAGPAFRTPPRDDFPLSNYPMFSEKKDPRVTIQQVIARDGHSADVILPPQFVANEEVMQAAATLRRAWNGGPERLATLCGEIASRVGASHRGDLKAAKEVLIVSRSHHAVQYFGGDRLPESEETLVRCEVRR